MIIKMNRCTKSVVLNLCTEIIEVSKNMLRYSFSYKKIVSSKLFVGYSISITISNKVR